MAALRIALLLLLQRLAHAQRTAAAHEVQPTVDDVVRAVWVHGPTYSTKLSGGAGLLWPSFAKSASTRPGSQCSKRSSDKYTGYDSDGEYCAKASAALDDDAHLLLYSGRLGVVVDVGGLRSGRRNLFPKMGALGTALPARAAYDALAAATTDIELASTCGTKTSRYALRSVGNSFVHAGLVRQGHAVTHIIQIGPRLGASVEP